MTIPLMLEALFLLAGAACFAVFVLYWIPDYFLSSTRYALWRVRDEIKQEIKDSSLPKTKGLIEYVFLIEWMIVELKRWNFLSCLVWYRPQRNEEIRLKFWGKVTEGLDESQSELMRKYHLRVTQALRSKVVFGSVSGWLLTIPTIMVVVALKSLKGEPEASKTTCDDSATQSVLTARLASARSKPSPKILAASIG